MRTNLILWSAWLGLAIALAAGCLEGIGLLAANAPRDVSEWIHALALYAWLGLAAGFALGAAAALLPADTAGRGRWIVAALAALFLISVSGYWINFAPWFPSFASTPGKLWTLALALAIAVVSWLIARAVPALRHDGRASRGVLLALLALLVLTATFYSRPVNPSVQTGPAREDAPPVFVILVDTLRKDHLGCFGYARTTSPNIDALAADGIRIDRSFTTSNFTLPSVATFFGGQFPSTHGVVHVEIPLPDSATLSERMAAAGYRCGAFVGNPTVKPERGFARGFSHFFPPPLPRWCHAFKTAPELIASRLLSGPDIDYASNLVPRALRWLDGQADDSTPFLYLHLMEPHSGYVPPRRYYADLLPEGAPEGPRQPPRVHELADPGGFVTWEDLPEGAPISPAEREGMLARYDGEIRLADEWIGRFLDALKHRKLYDPALIVFLSDHGEEFDDHRGWFHGRSLYPEMIDMPLIVKLPGNVNAGERRQLSVDMVDLAPTFCALVEAEPGAAWHGRDRSAAIVHALGDSIAAPRFMERPPYLYGLKTPRWSLIKKIVLGKASWNLFDRVADPRETADLSSIESDTFERLREQLETLIAHFSSATLDESLETDPETERMLRSLGYVQ